MIRVALISAFVLVACGPNNKRNGDKPDGGGSGGNACSTPGDTQPCYSGPSGTAGVGQCAMGTQTCGDDGNWGGCVGEVLPVAEVCADSVDNNCNGMADEDVDADGDGFTTCGGDCCDSVGDGCADPKLVNPGAFEAMGNMVDDDCDGMVDNTIAASCDQGLNSASADANDYAKAMELCQTATMTDKKWGVISARFTLPSGTGTPNAAQRAIRPAFGSTTVQAGSSMAVLSTGHAAATGQTNPAFASFQIGTTIGTSSAMPADWIAANGGNLPNAPGCPDPLGGTTANDPIMLELKIRTPSNAKSFKLSTNFMSAEFPEWVCTEYNDFFVVLLDSTWNGQPANPTDKNLAFYTSSAMQKYPVGVNLANGNTGLFTVCKNGAIGCDGSAPSTISTCVSDGELAGTGMDGTANSCATGDQVGGGTGWLVTSGNVNGGEIITLRIAIWDTSDGIYDSVSMIDHFEWSVDASQPGTVIP